MRTTLGRTDLPGSDTWSDRLRDAGIIAVETDRNGSVVSSHRRGHDWLEDLLVQSPLVRSAIRDTCDRWDGQDEVQAERAFPGLWLLPVPLSARRSRRGYAIAMVITEELLSGEHLHALCQASSADYTTMVAMLSSLPPAAKSDLGRLGTLFRLAWESEHAHREDRNVIESIGRELSESYEEISLLYTITGSMHTVNHPERFIELACDELLQTLPYTWIGVQLFMRDRLPRAGADLVIRGEAEVSTDDIRAIVAGVRSRLAPGSPAILKDGGPFGRAAVVEPITSDGQLIGVLMAADKFGPDTSVSSVDIKLLTATAAQLAIFLENAALYEDLSATFLGTLQALTASIDAKDRYTCGHSQRVALLTAQLAAATGMDADRVERVRIAGLVHDIGKIGVPEAVLLKKGQLCEEEFAWIRRHPEIGARILRDIPQMEDIIGGVMHHHERFDGKGYPHGLAGEDIPVIARMIALADTFDAMSSSRTYRTAMTRSAVLQEMSNGAGTQFDPELAERFFRLDFSAWESLILDHQTMSASGKERAA